MKEWKNGLSQPSQEKTILRKDLEEIQDEIEQKEVTKEMLMKEKEIEGKILVLQRKEDSELRPRSRCIWLKVGDQTRNFFIINVKREIGGALLRK